MPVFTRAHTSVLQVVLPLGQSHPCSCCLPAFRDFLISPSIDCACLFSLFHSMSASLTHSLTNSITHSLTHSPHSTSPSPPHSLSPTFPRSVYLSVSNMGYHIGLPQSVQESLLWIAVINFHACLSAFILGTMFHYLIRKDPAEEALSMLLHEVNLFSENWSLPSRLRTKLCDFIKFQHEKVASKYPLSLVEKIPTTPSPPKPFPFSCTH